MEELKNKEQETFVTNEQKLEYENKQLKAMVNNMGQQLEHMNLANMFKRLDFLFKVVENKESFSGEFVISCINEIEERMTLEENVEQEETLEEE